MLAQAFLGLVGIIFPGNRCCFEIFDSSEKPNFASQRGIFLHCDPWTGTLGCQNGLWSTIIPSAKVVIGLGVGRFLKSNAMGLVFSPKQ